MYLTTHTPTSLIIGSQISHPLLAFILGFIAHLILDIIPHEDKNLSKWLRKNWIRRSLFIVCLDFILIAILLLILYANQKLNLNNYSIWAALLGGYMPDILWGFDDLFKGKIKILKLYHRFHNDIMHTIILKNFFIPTCYSIPIQIITFILTLWAYLKIV